MSDTIEEGGLGEADIEAAYGSGDGDLDTSATVASTPKGQIFEQIYRPWNGSLGPRWVRNYAIYRHHVYGIISGSGHRRYHPFVRLALLVVILGSMTPILMLLLSSMVSGDATGFLNRMWGVNRYNLWGNVLGYFPRNLCMWPLLTALVVGGLVSDDRKWNQCAVFFKADFEVRLRLDEMAQCCFCIGHGHPPDIHDVLLCCNRIQGRGLVIHSRYDSYIYWGFSSRNLPCIHIYINRHSTLKHQHKQIHGFSIFPRIDSRIKDSRLAS